MLFLLLTYPSEHLCSKNFLRLWVTWIFISHQSWLKQGRLNDLGRALQWSVDLQFGNCSLEWQKGNFHPFIPAMSLEWGVGEWDTQISSVSLLVRFVFVFLSASINECFYCPSLLVPGWVLGILGHFEESSFPGEKRQTGCEVPKPMADLENKPSPLAGEKPRFSTV